MKIKYNLEERKFNVDLSNWNTSNVRNLSHTFAKCAKFEGKGLDKWKTTNFVHTNNMFLDCKNFNCDLSKWKLKNILDMSGMFDGCTSLENKPSWYKK